MLCHFATCTSRLRPTGRLFLAGRARCRFRWTHFLSSREISTRAEQRRSRCRSGSGRFTLRQRRARSPRARTSLSTLASPFQPTPHRALTRSRSTQTTRPAGTSTARMLGSRSESGIACEAGRRSGTPQGFQTSSDGRGVQLRDTLEVQQELSFPCGCWHCCAFVCA